MKTEAWVLTQKGTAEKAFERKEIELAEPAEGQVLIDAEAFGLNYADVMARLGLYQEAPPMPCVIGYEVVGIISRVGAGVDNFWVGKRVVAFSRFGGYARHVLTDVRAVAEIKDMPAEQALALATQGVTAYYMTNVIAPVRTGDRVLVHAAAGGVGTLLIQLCKLNGAVVYAKAGNDQKINLCQSLGADHGINYHAHEYDVELKRVLGENRLDVSFNPVGGSTFRKDKALMGAGSRLVLFGGSELATGKWGIFSKLNFVRKMGFFTPIALMMQSKNLIGVNMLKIADYKPELLAHCLQEIVRLAAEGKIIPQSGGSFNANELPKAHSLLESGKSTGKITVIW